MDRAVKALPMLKVDTDQAARDAGAALEVEAAAALLWVEVEAWVLEGLEAVLELLEELPEVLPETRAESLESLTKDAVMVAFLQALGGSMDPETKLAATHYLTSVGCGRTE